jgi:hypothetical protein
VVPPSPPGGRPRRAWLYLAAALLLALAIVPAVTAQGGDGDHQDTVRICHFHAGKYHVAEVPEADFYGDGQKGHATHAEDIVPPFAIENPRPGDPGSFPGRNWGSVGQAILNSGCLAKPVVQEKVRICHATSSPDNPYVSEEPAVGNNGDLHGGHLDHTGPVYPAADWGDIIPPYNYVDDNGETQTFPGYNWSPEGQAIWQNGCEPLPPPLPERLTPVLECVEDTGDTLLAHFGYRNPNATTVEPPTDRNRFSPPPENRGQPTAFASGDVHDAFQADLGGGALTWSLTGNSVTASDSSPRCRGSIAITKRLAPVDDTGRFGLRIDGQVAGGAEAVGDGGSTGTIAVDTGRRTVSETAALGTQLGDYTIETVCRDGATVVASASGPSVMVTVRRNQAIVCVITNTRTGEPDDRTVTPVLECVLFDSGSPDVAYWGYSNPRATEVRIEAGSQANRFSPTPTDRGQPAVFEPGRHRGVFQTPLQAGRTTLAWNLTGRTASASEDSPACNPTVELRKVTIPANDTGVFQLRINGVVVATGGNGTTSGPLRSGIGEGTASETAGPGTNLADYDSRVAERHARNLGGRHAGRRAGERG